MNPGGFWKRFESSGQIEDYLAYKSGACTSGIDRSGSCRSEGDRPGQYGDVRREEWDAYDDDDNGAGAARDEDGRG